ncbi:peptidoglycan-binding protein [Planktomarina temperata]|nr:peptidoglycan-binding protein [Planktomarina temperata]
MPKNILVTLPFIVMLASPVLANSVAKSQRMLNQLGYNAGPIDGAYGGKTRGALEKFYADNGSLYDGKLDANEVADLTAAMGAAGLDLRVVHENLGTVVQKNSTKPYVISQPMKTDVRQRNGWYQIAATVQADMNNDGHLDTIYYGSAPFPEGGMVSWEHNNATQCGSGCNSVDTAPFEVRLTNPYSNKPGIDISHKFINDDTPNQFRGKAVMNVLVADFNGDGINDLYMSDTGRRPGNPGKNDPIYLSQPNGTWKEVSLTNVSGTGVIRGEGLINFTHGGDVGDIDGDGDIDVVLPSNDWVGTNGEVLCLMNDGAGQFKSKKCGNQIGQSLALGDYDGDGDLDLYIGKEHLKAIKQFNVMKYAGNESRGFVGVFKNDGKGNFTRKLSKAFDAATDKNGFYFLSPIHQISFDWDNDGDIDILSNEVTIAYASQGIVMYENDGSGKRFSTSVVQHNGFNKDDTGPATKKEFPLDNEISKWNANFALRMMAQDYNKDGLMDFSLEGSAGGMRTSGYGVFINKGNMKFEYVPKNYPEWHSPVNPNWIRLKIRLIEP